MLKLILPTVKYKRSFLTYMRELVENGKITKKYFKKISDDFHAFVNSQKAQTKIYAKDDVPKTQFWILSGKEIVGQGVIHHKLNKQLRLLGGQVGYSIRPSFRKHGLGTIALQLLLAKAREYGFKKVLLVARKKNIPSIKIIQRAGGVFLNSVLKNKIKYSRYSIKLN